MPVNIPNPGAPFTHAEKQEEGIKTDGRGKKWEENICLIKKGTAQTLSNNTKTNITWDLEDKNEVGMFVSTSNDTISIKEDGYYLIMAGVSFKKNGTGQRQLGVEATTKADGAIDVVKEIIDAESTDVDRHSLNVTKVYYFEQGDTIQVKAKQDSGGDLNIQPGAEYNYFQVVRIAT